MFSPLVTLTFLLPLLAQQAQAGLFTKDSPVKMLDQKLFKRAMVQNRTAVVAFVAPWCGVSVSSVRSSIASWRPSLSSVSLPSIFIPSMFRKK
jgi:hypothetical protein